MMMTQGTFGVIQGTFGVIQGTFSVIQGTFGMRQGTFGVIQGTFRVIQGTFGVIQGTFGVIQGTFGLIQVMMIITSLFGQLGRWALSSGVRDVVCKSITHVHALVNSGRCMSIHEHALVDSGRMHVNSCTCAGGFRVTACLRSNTPVIVESGHLEV
jgi:hypothetical protein